MLSTPPLISVIVPVYNSESSLEQCLDSICRQTYKNLEIICVNDGSTDNSGQILDEYRNRDSRLIVITQENAGLSVARNTALDIATGDWIASVDSDDWIEPDTYEYFANHIGNSSSNVAIIGVDVIKMPQQQVLRKEVIQGEEGDIEITPQLLTITSDWFWNKIWKASFIKESGVKFPAGMWWEDVVFCKCLLPYVETVLNLPRIKYHYIRNQDGNSILDNAVCNPKSLDMIHSVEMVLDYYKEHPLPDKMLPIKGLLLQKMYRHLTSPYTTTPAIQMQAWDIMRRLVDKHRLLPNNEKANPELLLQYYLPPCAYAAVKSQESRFNSLNNKSTQIERKVDTSRTKLSSLERQLVLARNFSRILYCYRIAQIKHFFSWGKRRAKYYERKQRLKLLVRECRNLRLTTHKLFTQGF